MVLYSEWMCRACLLDLGLCQFDVLTAAADVRLVCVLLQVLREAIAAESSGSESDTN
jgi:hypothetical protein